MLIALACALPAHAQEGRSQLTAEFLRGGEPMKQPVNLSAFARSSEAVAAKAPFQGRLSFRVRPGGANFELLRDLFAFEAGNDNSYRYPPAFEFTFVQAGERIVPTQRGAIPSQHSWWEWIVEPGRVWSEPADGDWSRAAVPFTLEEKNANCMHNGVLTFVYSPRGEVSRVAWQISQETCRYFQFNAWGATAARYEPGEVRDASAIAAQYVQQEGTRLPLKTMADLAKDFPQVDVSQFASPSDVSPAALTTYGVVVDGVHYAGQCLTRHGAYPFCDELVMPSYSVAKSLYAGIGLMRLELLHPGVKDERIADYVPQCARAGWKDITFDNALDMATGRYDSLEREADEDASATANFFISLSHAEKIRFACTRYPQRQAPGKQWVYHTTDTYAVGTAMSEFWRRKHGKQADFYRDVLVTPVWRRLNLSPVVDTTRRTYDNVQQPFAGWGLALLRDDFAKLGMFLARDQGKVGDEPLVAPREMLAALHREALDSSLPAPAAPFSYNNGVWGWNARVPLGCRDDAWIAFMSGYGGISVVMMPTGVVYYYVSDNNEFRWARAVAQANQLRPFCTPP